MLTQMRSVGEVMSIARDFTEGMQKAMRMVNSSWPGTKFTCCTSTKVQILTAEELAGFEQHVMPTYAHVCPRMLTYAHVCLYFSYCEAGFEQKVIHNVCRRVLTYADVC
jgi:hypothetical protein